MAIYGRDFAGRVISKAQAEQRAKGIYGREGGKFLSKATVAEREKSLARERLEQRRAEAGKAVSPDVIAKRLREAERQAFGEVSQERTPKKFKADDRKALGKHWSAKVYKNPESGSAKWYLLRKGSMTWTVRDDGYGPEAALAYVLGGIARGKYTKQGVTVADVATSDDFDEFIEFSASK